MVTETSVVQYGEQFQALFLEMCLQIIGCDGVVRPAEVEQAVLFLERDLSCSANLIDRFRSRLQRDLSADLIALESLNLYDDVAKELVLRAAVEIAAADGEFCRQEQRKIIELGFLVGCDPFFVEGLMRSKMQEFEEESLRIKRAYLTLGVSPDAPTDTIEQAYQSFRNRYSSAALEVLGPDFVSRLMPATPTKQEAKPGRHAAANAEKKARLAALKAKVAQERLAAIEASWDCIQRHRERGAFFGGEPEPVAHGEAVRESTDPSLLPASPKEFLTRAIQRDNLSIVADINKVVQSWRGQSLQDLRQMAEVRLKGMSQKTLERIHDLLALEGGSQGVIDGGFIPWTPEWSGLCSKIQGVLELFDQGHVTTLGDLAQLVQEPPPRFRESNRVAVVSFLESLAEATGVTWAPTTTMEPGNSAVTLSDSVMPDWQPSTFSLQLGEYLQSSLSSRQWFVLCARFGLYGSEPRVLEDIGTELGLTRERIRQIEDKTIGLIQRALKQHREAELWRQILGYFQKEAVCIVPARALWQFYEQDVGLRLEVDRPVVNFFLWLNKIYLFESSNDQLRDSLYFSGLTNKQMVKLLSALRSLFHDHSDEKVSLPQLTDFLRQQTGLEWSPEAAGSLLISLPCVQRNEDGHTYSTGFCFLNRREQIFRVLRDLGEPTHYEEIALAFEQRLGDGEEYNIRSFSNYLVWDERIVPQGRSGTWGLAEWGTETRGIRELMIEALKSAGTPLSGGRIFESVLSRRPVSRNSIQIYLTDGADYFFRCGLDEWGLKRWENDPDHAENFASQVRQIIVEFLQDDPSREFPLSELETFMSEKTGLSARSCRAVLNWSPYLDARREGWGRTRCRFCPEGKSTPTTERKRSKPTQQMIFEGFLGEEFSSGRLGHDLPLRDVVKAAEDSLGLPPSATYALVQRTDLLEKYEDREGTKMCRYLGEDSD